MPPISFSYTLALKTMGFVHPPCVFSVRRLTHSLPYTLQYYTYMYKSLSLCPLKCKRWPFKAFHNKLQILSHQYSHFKNYNNIINFCNKGGNTYVASLQQWLASLQWGDQHSSTLKLHLVRYALHPLQKLVKLNTIKKTKGKLFLSCKEKCPKFLVILDSSLKELAHPMRALSLVTNIDASRHA